MSVTSDFFRQPTVFGEVLFDCFPDGRNILGGAPFNVAWHLQGFGCPPRFISRVGNDELGEQIADEMRRWGMDTSNLQQDDVYPTGRVIITITGDTHQFDILPEQAYDHIHCEEPQKAATSPLLYHGSLILRSAESARALAALKKSRAPVFLDINLRPPWHPEDLETPLREATWLKLNEDEFRHLSPETAGIDVQAVKTLRRRHDLQSVVVTCGETGAWWCDAENCTFYPAPKVDTFVDSVGAGDAFAAVVILGLLHGWSANRMMQRAQQFAARICSIRGATTHDRQLYSSMAMSWRDDD